MTTTHEGSITRALRVVGLLSATDVMGGGELTRFHDGVEGHGRAVTRIPLTVRAAAASGWTP